MPGAADQQKLKSCVNHCRGALGLAGLQMCQEGLGWRGQSKGTFGPEPWWLGLGLQWQ